VWNDNIYTLWLKALRCLSNAASCPNAAKFPQIMRTKEWAHRDMETQFASWSEMRHDTILIVKQSYSGGMMLCCDYPAGFVDPRVEFWDVLIEMGKRVEEVEAMVGYGLIYGWSQKWEKVTTTLKQLAQKELDQKPFSKEESDWIKNAIHKHHMGSGGDCYWTGWYCELWPTPEHSEKFDPTVADVHTAPPSPDFGFKGTVLSEGVGNVNMMIAAVDNGKDLTMYAGPVFSHFEIIPNGVHRFTDSEWKDVLEKGRGASAAHNILLTYPEWAKGYVVY